MPLYALLQNNTVVAIFEPHFPDLPISQQISPDLNPVDVSSLSAPPALGSTYDGKTFTAPPAPPTPPAPATPTVAELQAQIAALQQQLNAIAAKTS